MHFTDEMSVTTRKHISLPLLLRLLSCISLCVHLSVAVDSISSGQSLSGYQTIVSKEGKFEMGFFSPGNSHNYYIGIWFKKITEKTIIWVANRERPVSDVLSSELTISENGNLVLLNSSKIPIWSSNSTLSASNSNEATLLDTGNLVLKGGLNSSVFWQSFDHPTDTWMPGGPLGLNKITGEKYYLNSWKNSEDPAPGSFFYIIDTGKSNEFFLWWNKSVRYWGTGVWNGHFSSMPEVNASPKFNFSFVENEQQKYYNYSVKDDAIIARATLDFAGQIKLWLWINESHMWQSVWTQPIRQCAVYSLCGSYGVCDEKSLIFCKCLRGFEPASTRDWDLNDHTGGCLRKTHLQCSNYTNTNREKDRFLTMPNLQLPQNPVSLVVGSAEECESACLDNCNCTAYAYGTGCSIWSGGLLNLQQLYDGDNNAQTLYLRLAASELPSSSRKRLTNYIIVAVVVAVTIFCIVLVIAWRCQRRSEVAIEGSLTLFTYNGLQRITKNFSEKLGGGGFGSVFKGALPDSTTVAVKKLEGIQQGQKQFQTEVITLGTIQHVNLIRLCGFCAEGTKRLLVYDYMPNGSLDSHLFLKTSSILDWNTRYLIILGIARGLTYLHEKCRECIIHCDIKPENILLDAEFCPKVADFGLAKLLGRDFSRVLTTMRGTIGYLAPEWISGLAITPKADVYSFGMMLFEIISGRRNIEKSKDGKIRIFPLSAAIKVCEGEVIDLLDHKLDGIADRDELSRVCRVACWCIQDCETHRPSMGQVVQILEGALEVNIPPIPRSLQHLTEDQDMSS